jgi:anti-sigma factor RsiW
MMDRACNREELEALARGRLSPERSEAAIAHAAACAECQRELSWLRAEVELMAGRAARELAPPERMWLALVPQLPRVAPGLVAGAEPWFRRTWLVAVALVVAGAVAVVALARQRPPRPIVTVAPAADQPRRTLERDVTATQPVDGPVRVVIETSSADVTVVAGERQRLKVELTDGNGEEIRFTPIDGGYRVDFVAPGVRLFDGHGRLASGSVRVEVPEGSQPVVSTTSGDVNVQGVHGDGKVRTTSGDVAMEGPRDIDVQTTSGDVRVTDQRGAVARVRTSSGDATIVSRAAGEVNVELDATSGDLDWTGSLGGRLAAHTSSGDVKLHLAPPSGFELELQSASGELHDGLGMERLNGRKWRFGNGAGRAVVRTASGDLSVDRAEGWVPAKERGMGRIRIETVPWAMVQVDGRTPMRTPAAIDGAVGDRVHIMILQSGYQPRAVDAIFREDDQRLSFALEPDRPDR